MKTTTSLLALLSAAANAAGAATTTSMAANVEWTMTGLSRPCNDADTVCTWKFGIQTAAGTTSCTFNTTAVGSTPASEAAAGGPATCGVFTVTTGWSGQFGSDQGFTTLAVADSGSSLIAYPAYTDAQLANGAVVSPDQSYPVQVLG